MDINSTGYEDIYREKEDENGNISRFDKNSRHVEQYLKRCPNDVKGEVTALLRIYDMSEYGENLSFKWWYQNRNNKKFTVDAEMLRQLGDKIVKEVDPVIEKLIRKGYLTRSSDLYHPETNESIETEKGACYAHVLKPLLNAIERKLSTIR